MVTAKIDYESELTTEVTHVLSGVKIKTDAPIDNNGKGSAFSPTDLMSASLSCCMITLAGIKAKQKGFELGRIHSDVYKVMGTGPRRVVKIKVDLFFEQDFNPEEKEIIEDAVFNCPVAKSLHPDIIQDVRLHYNHKK